MLVLENLAFAYSDLDEWEFLSFELDKLVFEYFGLDNLVVVEMDNQVVLVFEVDMNLAKDILAAVAVVKDNPGIPVFEEDTSAQVFEMDKLASEVFELASEKEDTVSQDFVILKDN